MPTYRDTKYENSRYELFIHIDQVAIAIDNNTSNKFSLEGFRRGMSKKVKTNFSIYGLAFLFCLAFALGDTVFAQNNNFGYGGPNPRSRVPAQVPPRNLPPKVPQQVKDRLPKQLFDIRLLLDRSSVINSQDLVARVTFDSFGSEPTPVQMTFAILDSSKKVLWESTDSTTVETASVFAKRFNNAPQLPKGSYIVQLKTLYNQDVTDTFEAPFNVVSLQESNSNALIYWLLGLGGLIVLTLVLKQSGKKSNKKSK